MSSSVTYRAGVSPAVRMAPGRTRSRCSDAHVERGFCRFTSHRRPRRRPSHASSFEPGKSRTRQPAARPLAVAGALVVAILGWVLTIDARDAARDGIGAQARAIEAYVTPLVAPPHGKPK